MMSDFLGRRDQFEHWHQMEVISGRNDYSYLQEDLGNCDDGTFAQKEMSTA